LAVKLLEHLIALQAAINSIAWFCFGFGGVSAAAEKSTINSFG